MSDPVYAVIDTNVLVSALITKNPESPVVRIFKFLAQNKLVPVFSEEIVSEYREVLSRPKFKIPLEVVNSFVNEIISRGKEISELIEVKERLPDSKDVVFYAVTLSNSESTYLVTGNLKHFPEKPFVVSPSEMIKILEA